uniref:BTB domain-containing protein n=1 Tax=Stomoxys calcitrans TaxID=35570 RepID=A0A1I8Q1K6_STOCA
MEQTNAGSATNLRSPRVSEQISHKFQEQSQQQQPAPPSQPQTTTTTHQSFSQHHHHQSQQQQQQQTQPHHHSHSPQIPTQQQQQQNNEHQQQQFCLRWHNHQTSLLSTLPILLDQSHLTDVTISAEGRTLRAHRVVLSACSSFFLEIFRTLDNTHHPVIIIPGASFQAIVALLTFMYSGEVNVYEEQIPTLLSLAETLGIKGLADVHNNKSSHKPTALDTKETEEPEKSVTPPTPPPSSSSQATSGSFTIPQAPVQPTALATSALTSTSPFSPLLNPVLNSKFPSPLENFFLKSLQFYPNFMHQPLNFSQTALNKTSEILAKYQQQCNLYQAINSKDLSPLLPSEEGNRPILNDELHGSKRFCGGLDKKPPISSTQMGCGSNPLSSTQQKDIKRIDKIVENLRSTTSSSNCGSAGKILSGNHDNNNSGSDSSLSSHLQNPLTPLSIKTSMENYTINTSPLLPSKSSLFSSPSSAEPNSPLHHPQLGFSISPEDQLKLQQHLDKYAASCAAAAAASGNMSSNDNGKPDARSSAADKLSTPQSPQNKAPSSSKLYATCFICHKQLSNQYNLRVHLETHQNVRYACNVCSHVSRSKDALRKHVSYRHPGAPSPCETEARRKRANKLLASTINAAAAAASASSPNADDLKSTTMPNTPPALQQSFQNATAAFSSVERMCSEQLSSSPQQQLTAAQLNSAYHQMFLPNQFHLAAANAVVQQHLRENQQSPTTSTPTTMTPTTTPTKELTTSNSSISFTPTGMGNVANNSRTPSSPLTVDETKSNLATKQTTPVSSAPNQTPESTTPSTTLNALSELKVERRKSPLMSASP